MHPSSILPAVELAWRSLAGAFRRDEGGATAIEYGLITSLIFLVIVATVTLMATKVTGMWNTISSHI